MFYLGRQIFILRKRVRNDLSGFLCGIFLTVYTTYASIQYYDFEHNSDIITGITIGLGKPSKGHKTIEYTYFYNGRKYYDSSRKDTFKVIYPNGKYQVTVAKRFPSFSRIDFSKPIE